MMSVFTMGPNSFYSPCNFEISLIIRISSHEYNMAVLFVNNHKFIPYFITSVLIVTFSHLAINELQSAESRPEVFQRIGEKEGHGNLVIPGPQNKISG